LIENLDNTKNAQYGVALIAMWSVFIDRHDIK